MSLVRINDSEYCFKLVISRHVSLPTVLIEVIYSVNMTFVDTLKFLESD
jgi:hypothetical protein